MIDWRILAAMRLKWQCSDTVKSGVGIYKEIAHESERR
jgi:hypothetical protein